MIKINEYYSIKKAADFLGVTQNTLRNWEAAGKLKPLRNPANNYRLYESKDLLELLKDIKKMEPNGKIARNLKLRNKRAKKIDKEM